MTWILFAMIVAPTKLSNALFPVTLILIAYINVLELKPPVWKVSYPTWINDRENVSWQHLKIKLRLSLQSGLSQWLQWLREFNLWVLGKFVNDFTVKMKNLSIRMLPKMQTGISVSMSMECLWQDAFTIVKITVIAKMHVLLSLRVVHQIVPVRLVKWNLCDLMFDLLNRVLKT